MEIEEILVWLLRRWVILLLFALFIGYLLSVSKKHIGLLGGGGSLRVTSANLATCLINLATISYFYLQSRPLEVLFGRATEIGPAHQVITELNASSFLGVIVLVVVRAFYVIGEFDNGLYNLSPSLPDFIAKHSGAVRWTDLLLRFGIMLVLFFCASSLIKKSSPFDLRNLRFSMAGSFGSPSLAESGSTCAHYARIAALAGQTKVTAEACVEQAISEYDLPKTLSTIEAAFDQISVMPVSYALMFTWSLTMLVLSRRSNFAAIDDTRKVLLIQLFIPLIASIQFGCTWMWVNLATSNHCFILCRLIPNMDPLSGRIVELLVLSFCGFAAGLGALCLLSVRAYHDGAGFARLAKAWYSATGAPKP